MSKISRAIKERRLIKTAKNKIKEKMPLYLVDDQFIRSDIEQLDVARKLEKKYSYVIKNHKYPILDCPKTKKVWVLWLQGEERAPEIVKACIASTRRAFKGYEYIVLDENNIHDYVELPDYIEEKYKKGIITHAHYSDIVRAALLSRYGGVWIDATVYCTADKIPAYISEAQLFVFKDIKIPLYRKSSIVASSWFIVARKNDPILSLTYDLLKEYWKNEVALVDYFVFHIFFSIATRCYEEEWDNVLNYSNVPPHILQAELGDVFRKERWEQICKMSDIHKLNRHVNYKKNNTVYEHILDSIKNSQ